MAKSDSIIKIDEGIYVENITINKPLTFQALNKS
jgi:hypothetical protein